jgi:hypothetical protein
LKASLERIQTRKKELTTRSDIYRQTMLLQLAAVKDGIDLIGRAAGMAATLLPLWKLFVNRTTERPPEGEAERGQR